MAQIDRGRWAERRPESSSPESSGVPTIAFACSGEVWTIGREGAYYSLRDTKGLTYIQRLLQHPGEEFHALDLINGPGIAASSAVDSDATVAQLRERQDVTVREIGDAGEMLDEQAKLQYKRRLHELAEVLEDLRERGAHERAEAVASEIDSIERELARAFGLGGRNRRAGSAAERARLNVTRTIKAALQKIAEHNDSLGELLDRSIRTGTFCSYVEDPKLAVSWQFSILATTSVEAESTAPIFVSRETDLFAEAAVSTAFVGREAEVAMLHRLLEQARRGEGRTVMIAGAPGVGKTRLAKECANEASKRGFLSLVGGCYDRDDLMPFTPFVEVLEAAFAKAPRPEAFRLALGDDAAEIARLMPQLRRIFPDIPPAQAVPLEQSRRTLLNAVAEIIVRTAKEFPVLLVLEDLQWADEGSLSLLNHLARSLRNVPLMIVGTYRDIDFAPAGPLNKSLEELARSRLADRLDLRGLPEIAVTAMLRALSGLDPPSDVVNFFYAHTEGNPFFVEELYWHLFDQAGLITPAGEFRRDLRLEDLEIPASLRLVISRRLARLNNDTQKFLGMAAVIGRFFTFELLEAATNSAEDQLLDGVEEAERAGLISSVLLGREARFNFSHELIRQTIVSGLSPARRQRLHLRVADAIERVYPNTLEDQANELAHHLVQAGAAADVDRTVRYLSMAAKRTRLQGALTETGALYRQALALLETTPETLERDQLELGLRLALGAVLMATRGYADAETGAAYQRAMALGERLGDPMQVVLALTGVAAQPLLRGELDTAQAVAEQVLATSQRDGKSRTQVWGYYIDGVVRYHRGAFALAWERFSQARAVYLEEEHRRNPQDPGSETLEYMALTAWQLGMADSARARMREAITLNEQLRKPYARVHCEFYAAYLHVMLRDPVTTQKFAESVMTLSKERRIPLYFDVGRILYGWAIAQQGRCDEGVRYATDGLASFKAAGNRLGVGSFFGFLAEALASAGALDGALATVEEALCAAPDQLADLPYLLWLRGKFLLENTGRAGTAQICDLDNARLESAEESLRKASSLALSLGAKSFAIRSATSLARLLEASDRTVEAREIVEPLLKSMTEGLDTRELAEARQLMEELG